MWVWIRIPNPRLPEFAFFSNTWTITSHITFFFFTQEINLYLFFFFKPFYVFNLFFSFQRMNSNITYEDKTTLTSSTILFTHLKIQTTLTSPTILLTFKNPFFSTTYTYKNYLIFGRPKSWTSTFNGLTRDQTRRVALFLQIGLRVWGWAIGRPAQVSSAK